MRIPTESSYAGSADNGVFCVERLRFSKKINIYGVGRWGGGRGGGSGGAVLVGSKYPLKQRMGTNIK